MDDETKKKISIGIVVGCIVLAGIIFFTTRTPSGTSSSSVDMKVALLCANPECGQTLEITIDEYAQELDEQGADPIPGGPVLRCSKCQEFSLYMAEKCAKCGEIFVDDGSETCPKCGAKIE